MHGVFFFFVGIIKGDTRVGPPRKERRRETLVRHVCEGGGELRDSKCDDAEIWVLGDGGAG